MRKYTIDESDYYNVREYIDKAMKEERISTSEGFKQYRDARTAELLQAYCDDYLSADQMTKLRQAIRKKNQRNKNYKSLPKSIDINANALDALHMMIESAKNNGYDLTLSGAINALTQHWDSANHFKKIETLDDLYPSDFKNKKIKK